MVKASALQIISADFNNETQNFSFNLLEENLKKIFEKIPNDKKVAVVSVVGAFRTGKSFLLTFMLRFLRHALGQDDDETSEEWITSEGEFLTEGNFNIGTEEPAVVDAAGHNRPREGSRGGFGWKGGHQRKTTGIWMWSEPFFRTVANEGEIAILLVDTQGMFDNDTPMALLSCIFGLSTLISSHQIYNVDKKIQEDNLQQLALFAEYGRMAWVEEERKTPLKRRKPESAKPVNPQENNAEAVDADKEKNPSDLEGINNTEVDGNEEPTINNDQEDADEETTKPFQRLEFLVRDWQHFDNEEDYHLMTREMDSYIKGVVFDEKLVPELKETRNQILGCYEKISCFLLPYPGTEVTKKHYDGDIMKIDPLFRKLLNRFVRRTFGSFLAPKRMIGKSHVAKATESALLRESLTASELKTYIIEYVKLFQAGAHFPTAKTMLQATAEANNRNAFQRALTCYKREMDKFAGPQCSVHIEPKELIKHHNVALAGSKLLFKGLANMGGRSAITSAQQELSKEIGEEFARYQTMNDQRNPWQYIEYYLIPMLLAGAAFIMAWIAEVTCSSWSTTCQQGAHALGHVYMAIFTFMVIMSFGRIIQVAQKMKKFVKLVAGDAVRLTSGSKVKQA